MPRIWARVSFIVWRWVNIEVLAMAAHGLACMCMSALCAVCAFGRHCEQWFSVATSNPTLRSSFINLSMQWKENTREAWGSCSCQTEGMMGKSEWSQPAGSAVQVTRVEFWCREAAGTWLLWWCSSSVVFEQNLRQTQTGGNSRHVNSWH